MISDTDDNLLHANVKIPSGTAAEQDSECCTGTRNQTDGVCLCKADWTYIEEADEALCCSTRYADRMCVPEGYEPGYSFPVSPDLVPVPAGNSTDGSSVKIQESSFVDPGGSASR